MDDLTQDKLNIPAWVSLAEASKVLNLQEKTVKEHCRLGKFDFKIERCGKKLNYFVYFESLPQYAKNKYLGTISNDESYADAPTWAKIQVEKYLPFLKKSKGLKGEELSDYIKSWNDSHPDVMTS